MNNPFTALWQYLPNVGSELWSYNSKVAERIIRQRSALELLAGALWHLELASELGEFPKENMRTFFKGKGGNTNPQPWEVWLEQSKGLSGEFLKDELLARYRFSSSSDPSVSFLLQSMLIADAALRIDGARDLLRRNKNPDHFLFAKLEDIEGWLGKASAGSQRLVEKIKMNLTILVTFRDSYMHGEKPDSKHRCRYPQYSKFRENFFNQYKLAQVVEACQEIWKELVKLASSMKI